MNNRMISLACAAALLAGCTTTGGGLPRNALESAWNGKSAGIFFAQFGPPAADEGDGRNYTWKGGYKTVRIPAKYAEGEKGKKGKRIAPAKNRYLSCTVKLTVDEGYMIRSIKPVADRPGVNGPSYCAEFLAGKAAK